MWYDQSMIQRKITVVSISSLALARGVPDAPSPPGTGWKPLLMTAGAQLPVGGDSIVILWEREIEVSPPAGT